jgi:hypothetical protein
VANLKPVSTTLAANFATSNAGVVDTGGKFATDVVDTGGKFATGVVDTGVHLDMRISPRIAKNLKVKHAKNLKS